MNITPGRKKILLHLDSMKRDFKGTIYPFSYCQDGIAQNVGLSQNRISKLLNEMEEEGLIDKRSRKVKETPHKRYVYFLTGKGEKKAEKFKENIEQKNIHVKTEEGTTEIKLRDIENYVKGSNSYLFALNKIGPDNVLDLTDIGNQDIFVDRKEEKRELKNDIKAMKEGSFNTLLIKGCMGVGKTRLVREIKDQMRAEGIEFFEGESSCKAVRPFSTFREIFSEILKEVPEKIEESNISELFEIEEENSDYGFEYFDISGEDFFNRMKNFLENLGSEKPIMVFIDNLQWLESGSLKLFEFLTSELEKSSVYIIGAYREEYVDDSNSDTSIEDIVHSKKSKIIEVRPFDWGNTRKLLITKMGRKDIPGEFVDMIYQVTEGIPLFIEAITEELLESRVLQPLKEEYPKSTQEIKLPDKLKNLYNAKFEDLDKKEKKVLQICSCVKSDIPEYLIIRTISEEEDETKQIIENLKKAKLLEDTSEDRLDFTYEILRFIVYETLSKSKKKNLHERLTEHLEKSNEEKGAEYYSRLGRHYEKTRKFTEATRSYLKGGEKAKGSYENEKAVKLYERALKLLEEHPSQEIDKNEIHENIAEILERNEDYIEALNHLKRTQKETVDERRIVRLQRKIARCLRKTSQYKRATNQIEKGEEILARMEQPPSDLKKEKCKLLKEKGMLGLRKNDFDECQKIFQDMRGLSEKIGSKKDKAEAIHYLGAIAYYQSNFDQAKEYYQRSIEIKKDTDDLMGLSKSYNNLGVVFRKLQEPFRALEFYKKANEIEKEIGPKEGDPSVLDNIGIIYCDLGNLDKSLEYHQKCLEVEKKIDDEHGVAATLDNIGVVHFAKGEFDEALEYHKRSVELKKELEDRSGISFSLYNMGVAYGGKGEFEKSLNHLKESLKIRRELEDKLNIGYSKLWVGIVYLEMGEFDKSDEWLKDALDIFKETKSDHGMGMTLTYLGRLKVLQSSMDEAKKYLDHSEKIKSKLEEENYKLIVDRHLAEFYLKKNRLEKSLAHCQGSLRRAKRSGMMNHLGKCRKVLGNIYWEKGLVRRGKEEFRKAINIFDETGDKKNKAEVMFKWEDMLIENGKEEKGAEKRSEAEKLFNECNLDI